MNPLLDFSGLPRFADFRVEHVTPAKVAGTDLVTGRSDKVTDVGQP